jgi:hypothetical protein
MSVEDRFWSKVDKSGECWIWTASLDRKGYGQFAISKGQIRRAHRVAYELAVGPIPEGMEPDHLCRIHACVRPSHLEPVTHAENIRRGVGTAPQFQSSKTECPNHHPYDMVEANGARRCRECRRTVIRRASARYAARLKAVA